MPYNEWLTGTAVALSGYAVNFGVEALNRLTSSNKNLDKIEETEELSGELSDEDDKRTKSRDNEKSTDQRKKSSNKRNTTLKYEQIRSSSPTKQRRPLDNCETGNLVFDRQRANLSAVASELDEFEKIISVDDLHEASSFTTYENLSFTSPETNQKNMNYSYNKHLKCLNNEILDRISLPLNSNKENLLNKKRRYLSSASSIGNSSIASNLTNISCLTSLDQSRRSNTSYRTRSVSLRDHQPSLLFPNGTRNSSMRYKKQKISNSSFSSYLSQQCALKKETNNSLKVTANSRAAARVQSEKSSRDSNFKSPAPANRPALLANDLDKVASNQNLTSNTKALKSTRQGFNSKTVEQQGKIKMLSKPKSGDHLDGSNFSSNQINGIQKRQRPKLLNESSQLGPLVLSEFQSSLLKKTCQAESDQTAYSKKQKLAQLREKLLPSSTSGSSATARYANSNHSNHSNSSETSGNTSASMIASRSGSSSLSEVVAKKPVSTSTRQQSPFQKKFAKYKLTSTGSSVSSNHCSDKPVPESPLASSERDTPVTPVDLFDRPEKKSLLEVISPDRATTKGRKGKESKKQNLKLPAATTLIRSKSLYKNKQGTKSLEKFIQLQKAESDSKSDIQNKRVFRESKAETLKELGLQVSPEKIVKSGIKAQLKEKLDAMSPINKPRSKSEIKKLASLKEQIKNEKERLQKQKNPHSGGENGSNGQNANESSKPGGTSRTPSKPQKIEIMENKNVVHLISPRQSSSTPNFDKDVSSKLAVSLNNNIIDQKTGSKISPIERIGSGCGGTTLKEVVQQESTSINENGFNFKASKPKEAVITASERKPFSNEKYKFSFGKVNNNSDTEKKVVNHGKETVTGNENKVQEITLVKQVSELQPSGPTQTPQKPFKFSFGQVTKQNDNAAIIENVQTTKPATNPSLLGLKSGFNCGQTLASSSQHVQQSSDTANNSLLKISGNESNHKLIQQFPNTNTQISNITTVPTSSVKIFNFGPVSGGKDHLNSEKNQTAQNKTSLSPNLFSNQLVQPVQQVKPQQNLVQSQPDIQPQQQTAQQVNPTSTISNNSSLVFNFNQPGVEGATTSNSKVANLFGKNSCFSGLTPGQNSPNLFASQQHQLNQHQQTSSNQLNSTHTLPTLPTLPIFPITNQSQGQTQIPTSSVGSGALAGSQAQSFQLSLSGSQGMSQPRQLHQLQQATVIPSTAATTQQTVTPVGASIFSRLGTPQSQASGSSIFGNPKINSKSPFSTSTDSQICQQITSTINTTNTANTTNNSFSFGSVAPSQNLSQTNSQNQSQPKSNLFGNINSLNSSFNSNNSNLFTPTGTPGGSSRKLKPRARSRR